MARMYRPATAMRVSVIIPNYNGAAFLKPCLDSIDRQVLPPSRVIVVDNGSTDESRSVVDHHPVKPEWIGLPDNQGFARAVNLGIREAQDDPVALLNNDAEADPRWLLSGARALEESPDVDFFACLVLRRNEMDLVDSAGVSYAPDGRPYPRLAGRRASACRAGDFVLAPSAGAVFFRPRFFDEVGLFDERFFAYLEDVDIGLRARLMGKRAAFLPDAVVYHYGGGTRLGDRQGPSPSDTGMRVRWIARNKIVIMARDLPAGLLIRWSPRMAAGLAKSFLYHTFISRQALAFLSGTVHGIMAVPGLMEERRALQGRRKISPRSLKALIEEGAR